LPTLLEQIDAAKTPEELESLAALLKPASADSSKWVASTLSEVAEFFGLSVQTVKQWRLESPPMPGGDGKYPLPEIVKWRHAKLSQSDAKTAKQQAEAELMQIAIEQKRLDLAKDKGELFYRQDVELWASTALIEARETIMALPGMIASSAPPEIREFAREETDRTCRAVLLTFQRRMESDIVEDEPEGK
jgi:hypothetical protein